MALTYSFFKLFTSPLLWIEIHRSTPWNTGNWNDKIQRQLSESDLPMCINRQLVAHALQLPHIHTCQSFPITLRHTSSVTCHVSREHHLPLIKTSRQNPEISLLITAFLSSVTWPSQSHISRFNSQQCGTKLNNGPSTFHSECDYDCC